MPRFKVTDPTLASSAEYDAATHGLQLSPLRRPLEGEPFTPVLLFRIEGEEGIHPATVEIDFPDGKTVSLAPGDTEVTRTGRVVMMNLKISGNFPLGQYRLRAFIDGEQVAAFGFNL